MQNHIDKMKEMFNLQKRLNEETNGLDWKTGATNKGRDIDWMLCIVQESSELINSFNWKHWKNIEAKHDFENAKVELVDIWHFMMSEIIASFDDLEDEFFEQLANDFYLVDSDICDSSSLDAKRAIESAKLLMSGALNYEFDNVFDGFFNCMIALQFTTDELYALYIGKNALNKFRQDHGYKEGTYIKEWNGEEDNVVMMDILKSNTDITFNELLLILQDKYQLVKG